MFGMKTSTKLTAVKIDLINIFLPFFLHKSLINLSPDQKKKKKKKKNQDFYSLIAKFISDVTDFGKKTHKITYFNIKSDCGLDFFYFYHSLGHVQD